MSTSDGVDTIESRIERARSHRESINRNLILVFAGIVILFVAIGGGIWIGLHLNSETLPEPDKRLGETTSEKSLSSTIEGSLERELAAKKDRYETMLSQLSVAIESGQFKDSTESGQVSEFNKISLSIEKAKELYKDGDIDSALRLLDLAVEKPDIGKSEPPKSSVSIPVEVSNSISSQSEDLQSTIVETSDRHLQILESPKSSVTIPVEVSNSISSQSEDLQSTIVETSDRHLQILESPKSSVTIPVEVSNSISSQSEDLQSTIVETSDRHLQISESPALSTVSRINDSSNTKRITNEISNADRHALNNVNSNEKSSSSEQAVPTSEHAADNAEFDKNQLVEQSNYRDMLDELDELLKSGQLDHPFIPGRTQALERIVQTREKSMVAFLEGDIVAAQRLLASTVHEAKTLASETEESFKFNMNVAKESYDSGEYNSALAAISQAAKLRPNVGEVEEWKSRIERMPELLLARRDADDARNAGKLEEELEALSRILKIVPDSVESEERVKEVKNLLLDQRFNRAVARVIKSIENGNLKQAKQALGEVKRIRPTHVESVKLTDQVELFERQQKRDQHLVAARRDVKQDNWEGALLNYGRALALDSTHHEANQGRDIATRILDLQRIIDDFVARPGRLSSANIAKAATNTVENAKSLAKFSEKLKKSISDLEKSIEIAKTPVPVQILSDNQTEISIRRIGRIGKTEKRTIELRPDTYTFEGKRKGYRSKLIEVVVKYNGGSPIEIRVICDERS